MLISNYQMIYVAGGIIIWNKKKITFHEYLLSKKGKEVHLSNDLCFKYAMQNQELASLVLNTLGFIVISCGFTIKPKVSNTTEATS